MACQMQEWNGLDVLSLPQVPPSQSNTPAPNCFTVLQLLSWHGPRLCDHVHLLPPFDVAARSSQKVLWRLVLTIHT